MQVDKGASSALAGRRVLGQVHSQRACATQARHVHWACLFNQVDRLFDTQAGRAFAHHSNDILAPVATIRAEVQQWKDARRRAKPRNRRHFDTSEGGRNMAGDSV